MWANVPQVTKGVIHLFKLSEPSQELDTEMMMLIGVPAKHKTPDLLQLTAPCHQVLPPPHHLPPPLCT